MAEQKKRKLSKARTNRCGTVHATMKEAQAAKMQSLITSPELPLGNHGGDRQPEVASECVHCGPKHPPACDGRTDEEDEQVKCKDQLEGASPFLSMGPILRAFQLFGVFNFHIGSDYNSFQRRPLRLLYAIVLNVVCTAGAFFSYYAWCAHRQLGMDQLVTALRQSFTETDFVVFCMGATLFEVRLAPYDHGIPLDLYTYIYLLIPSSFHVWAFTCTTWVYADH